jgi:sterol desaturase/sphingolipid hydroxylase (fatty acid hydroxylase superfamily)
MSDFILPEYSFFATFLFFVGIMILRYFLLAGGLYLLSAASGKESIDKKKPTASYLQKDIYFSLVSSIAFAFFGTLLIYGEQRGVTQIYRNIYQHGLFYLPISLLIFLFLHDTYFYWTHRLLHKWHFKECHYVHHRSIIPTAWTSFAFHPAEAVVQAFILPLLVLFIPIHWSMLALFLLLMSILGVLNHLGREHYPEFLEKKLYIISASHHQEHHQRVGVNFGLYFTFWDRWMGTEARRSK